MGGSTTLVVLVGLGGDLNPASPGFRWGLLCGEADQVVPSKVNSTSKLVPGRPASVPNHSRRSAGSLFCLSPESAGWATLQATFTNRKTH
jgi:hypothetical protein